MARKAYQDMTAQEKIESITRQLDKLNAQLEEVHAHEACRILVEAFVKGELDGGSIDWDEVNRAFEHAAKVFKVSDVKADLQAEEQSILDAAMANAQMKVDTQESSAPSNESPAMTIARQKSKEMHDVEF